MQNPSLRLKERDHDKQIHKRHLKSIAKINEGNVKTCDKKFPYMA